jgi:hypothetical protein
MKKRGGGEQQRNKVFNRQDARDAKAGTGAPSSQSSFVDEGEEAGNAGRQEPQKSQKYFLPFPGRYIYWY